MGLSRAAFALGSLFHKGLVQLRHDTQVISRIQAGPHAAKHLLTRIKMLLCHSAWIITFLEVSLELSSGIGVFCPVISGLPVFGAVRAT